MTMIHSGKYRGWLLHHDTDPLDASGTQLHRLVAPGLLPLRLAQSTHEKVSIALLGQGREAASRMTM